MGEVVRQAKSEYRAVGPLSRSSEFAWATRSERLMVLKGNECMVETLALAANDADLRSWSKVVLRSQWVSSKAS